MWFPNRSDTNRSVQSQKRARILKFRIQVEEELYYPSSENKGADQLRSYCEADLRLCFRLGRLLVFPCGGSFVHFQKRIQGLPQFKNPCWYEGSAFFCFPYFFLIGASKTGTTDLYNRIQLHPQIVSPAIKENHWLAQRLFCKYDTIIML